MKGTFDGDAALFDLRGDLGETRDRSGEDSDTAERLAALWNNWNRKNLGNRFPGEWSYTRVLSEVRTGLSERYRAQAPGHMPGRITAGKLTFAPGRGGLTAAFENVPAEHDGENAFRFRVAFSEGIAISYKTLRDESFTVTEGRVTEARRIDGRNDEWEITVEPDSREAVTITLSGGRACGTRGAVCTGGDDPALLGNSPSATVAAGSLAAPLTWKIHEAPGLSRDTKASVC